MAKRDQTWVKSWKVVVNNSAHSNMATVVGRFLTPEAAEMVAAAFRQTVYADPYNYRTQTDYLPEQKTVNVTTVAEIDVRVEEEGFSNLMTPAAIRLAQQNGIVVRDENGDPITLKS